MCFSLRTRTPASTMLTMLVFLSVTKKTHTHSLTNNTSVFSCGAINKDAGMASTTPSPTCHLATDATGSIEEPKTPNTRTRTDKPKEASPLFFFPQTRSTAIVAHIFTRKSTTCVICAGAVCVQTHHRRYASKRDRPQSPFSLAQPVLSIKSQR